MKQLYRLALSMLVLCVGGPQPEAAARPLKVVATLTTFADLVKTIGDESVEVSAIASPRFNPHFIEPKPSDVLKVKRAQLFVHAGLDLEAWRGPLVDAAGNTRIMPGQPGELDLSLGIVLLEIPAQTPSRSQGDIHLYGNPHYWTDPDNLKIMARALCDKLSVLDPSHAAQYQQRLAALLLRLDQKTAEWRRALAAVQGQELVGYHNEWPYLMRFAGLHMEQFLEPKPGIPPTPRQVEFLEGYMRQHHIQGIVQSSYFLPQAAQVLAKRTGARVVILCQNVQELPACGDAIAAAEYNVQQLTAALRPPGP
ncbi:MAG: zinc ABC transporter substrate-binding protein [Candidatus Omnitrophica bacterium]|nr:zinc ABC transporter substrate-binding protein [Candidatus Omnitrophota bacterium]